MSEQKRTAKNFPFLKHKDTELTYATSESAPFVKGRREFFHYRDLGVGEGSGGRLRAVVTGAIKKMQQPTGWHYHTCDVQFLYILSGWVDLEFETGDKFRVSAHQSLSIPAGLRHNEITFSDDFECIEITVPGEIGTVPCDPPEWMA